MSNTKNLCETIGDKAYRLGILLPKIPQYISNNLKYEFFDWQKNAFENFLTFQAIKEIENSKNPTHLMFNMATGTGKTLLMASVILYYYQQGYRHFLFFVNQNNIVGKTENNFIDNTHAKYLFKEKIVIDDKTITIKKVETFSDNPQNIEIKFTSIQKLYNDIHLPRENKTTLDDLHNKNIIMLADEAHHLNTDTNKKLAIQQEIEPIELNNRVSEAEIEKRGWEHTVVELILHKNRKQESNKNVLLEFTATIPTTETIAKKYEDKIIYKFSLKEFLQKGYTKEINLISSTLNKKERILQALLFQWYRHNIALKYGIANFKPVILFRSKTIEDSKTDYQEFLHWIEDLCIDDFNFLENISNKIMQKQNENLYEQGKSRTEQVLTFIKNQDYHFSGIVNWIKQCYQEKNTIITNSKNNSTRKEKTDEEIEKLLNNLEDKDNHIRAIFTVDRLTEGWDVLNLFDIVRLYQGQNAGGSTKKTPEATTKEKQLIGRGVRYFPFVFNDKIKNKRKFDDDLTHELRALEELYYYTYDENSRYISHLKEELKKDGYIRDDKILQTFSLKQEFQKTNFYKNAKICYNKQIDNPNRQKKSLDTIKKEFSMSYEIQNTELIEQQIDLTSNEDKQKLHLKNTDARKTITIKFCDIEKHIVEKAINIKAKQENSLLQFENLKKELDIQSMEELRTSQLANFEIVIYANNNVEYEDIENKDKLQLVLRFLDKVFMQFKSTIFTKIGSEFTIADFKKVFAEPKTKAIEEKKLYSENSKNAVQHDWYVLDSFAGTSEEESLIEFVKNTIGNLENKYKNIYLLRNEEIYKIYDFEQGRGFQPDFILFLQPKNKEKIGVMEAVVCYQVFIEAKGQQFAGEDGSYASGHEGWKEKFLTEITEKYGQNELLNIENQHYRLIGLPFFVSDEGDGKDSNNFKYFESKYNELLIDAD